MLKGSVLFVNRMRQQDASTMMFTGMIPAVEGRRKSRNATLGDAVMELAYATLRQREDAMLAMLIGMTAMESEEQRKRNAV